MRERDRAGNYKKLLSTGLASAPSYVTHHRKLELCLGTRQTTEAQTPRISLAPRDPAASKRWATACRRAGGEWRLLFAVVRCLYAS